MKIREAIRTKILRSYLRWLGVCGLVFLGLLLLPKDFSRIVWIPTAILVISVAYAYFMSKVRCQTCEYQFPPAVMSSIRRNAKKSRINYCPHCGADLDQEVGANNSFKPNLLRGGSGR